MTSPSSLVGPILKFYSMKLSKQKSQPSRNIEAPNDAFRKQNCTTALQNTLKVFNRNILILKPFHRILSSKFVATLFPCWEMRNLSTISIFQSLNDLEKSEFQPPSSSEKSQTYTTHAPFEVANAYKGRKETLKALSPHHLSS